ncbi:hypothetical protein MMC25_001410 [Agyrium rufum]|nr:hypothetical protein [Agyrium rufum]
MIMPRAKPGAQIVRKTHARAPSDGATTLTFYDIGSIPGKHRCFAPNPWKTRFALNFKQIPYKTEWIDLPDIVNIRKSLGPVPNRTLPNGEDFYTLPIIKHDTNNTTESGEQETVIVGDSFDIAVYLDQAFPSSSLSGPGELIPPGTLGLTKALNLQADAVFTPFAQLTDIPLNPATAEQTKQSWADRFGVSSFDNFEIKAPRRREILEECKLNAGDFAKIFLKREEGPWLDGKRGPMYADFVIGAWLVMLMRTCPEWEEILGWHDGVWKGLFEALGPWREKDFE